MVENERDQHPSGLSWMERLYERIGDIQGDVKTVMMKQDLIAVENDRRHAANIERLNKHEEKLEALEAKIARLWMYKGRVAIFLGIIVTAAGFFVHFFSDLILHPLAHSLGLE